MRPGPPARRSALEWGVARPTVVRGGGVWDGVTPLKAGYAEPSIARVAA